MNNTKNTKDIIHFGIMEPFFRININFWLLLFILAVIFLPISICFFQLKNFWNTLNFTLFVPIYFSAGIVGSRKIEEAVMGSLEKFRNGEIEEALRQEGSTGLFGKMMRNKWAEIVVIGVVFFSQLTYMINDLGIFDHKNPAFLDWSGFYMGTNFFCPKEFFFCYSILVQYFVLLFAIYAISALMQLISIMRVLFYKNRDKYILIPRPKYLGLDDFRCSFPYLSALVGAVIINGLTYIFNMRSWESFIIKIGTAKQLNVFWFWVIVMIVLFSIFRMRFLLDNFLKWGKSELNKELDRKIRNGYDNSKASQEAAAIATIEDTIFTIGNRVLNQVLYFISIAVGLLVFFASPKWVVAVNAWVQKYLIPYM